MCYCKYKYKLLNRKNYLLKNNKLSLKLNILIPLPLAAASLSRTLRPQGPISDIGRPDACRFFAAELALLGRSAA